MLPVYLDCNEEDIERAIASLANMWEYEITANDLHSLIDSLSGKLKEEYGDGNINIDNISFFYDMVNNLKTRIFTALNEIVFSDEASQDYLMSIVTRLLDYTNIKHSDYPNIPKELFDRVQEAIIQGNVGNIINELNLLNDAKEKYDFLMLCGQYLSNNHSHSLYYDSFTIDCNNIFDVFDLLKSREEVDNFFDTLRYVGFKFKISNQDCLDFRSDDLKNVYYKNNEFSPFNLITYAIENDKFDQVDNDGKINIDVNGVAVEVTISDLKNLCVDYETGKFDFFYFAQLAYYNGNIDLNNSDKEMTVNIKGIDVNISFDDIIFYLNEYGESAWEFGFLKELYNQHRLDNIDDQQRIQIRKYDLECSLAYLISCIEEVNDDDGGTYETLNISKLISQLNLSESQKIYYKSICNQLISLDDFSVIKEKDAMQFFIEHGSVDQGGLKKLLNNSSANSDEIQRLVDFCYDKYRLSENDALIIMQSLDSVGACSYANMCNIIYELYGFDEARFESDMHYKMVNDDGSLNGNQLLLDLYIYQNMGGTNNFIIENGNNSLSVNPNYLIGDNLLDVKSQEYMSSRSIIGGSGFNVHYMSDFLQENNSTISDLDKYYSETIYDNKNGEYEILSNAIENGDMLSISVHENFDMYRIGRSYHFAYRGNNGHAVTPVAITEEGVLVRSWGDLYYIPISDLACVDIIKQ